VLGATTCQGSDRRNQQTDRRLTCSSRSAPGSTVTSASAILVEISKVLESAILTVPPLSLVALTLDSGKEKGFGTCPWGSGYVASFVGGSTQRHRREVSYSQRTKTNRPFKYGLDGKMNSSCEGMWSKAVTFSWKFFARTSFGTCASQSDTCRTSFVA